MKYIIFILAFFISISAQAQTYTTAQLSAYIRAQWKTNDSLRKQDAAFQSKFVTKDANDNIRNAKIKSLEEIVELLKKSVFTVSRNDFFIDSLNQILYIRWKSDTVIIKRGN